MKHFTLLFALLCLLSGSVNGQLKRPISITNNTEEKTIGTISSIFRSYIKYEADETTESAEKRNEMKAAINALPMTVNKKDLALLIEVWMYYDPTDFPVRNMIMPIFKRNKQAGIAAIRYRIAHKKEWETKDGAPFSELVVLEEDLKWSK